MLIFRAKEKGGFPSELVDAFSASDYTWSHQHLTRGYSACVSMAALFTNTILGFQRLLCNSWESAGFVCLWAEESNSLIHSQGALVWLWQGHEPKIKVSRSGSAQYAVYLPQSQRQCFNTGLILFFFFSSFSKQNQLCQTFLWVWFW